MAPWLEDSCYLAEGRAVSHRVMQHVQTQDEIESLIKEGQRLRVGPRTVHP